MIVEKLMLSMYWAGCARALKLATNSTDEWIERAQLESEKLMKEMLYSAMLDCTPEQKINLERVIKDLEQSEVLY